MALRLVQAWIDKKIMFFFADELTETELLTQLHQIEIVMT